MIYYKVDEVIKQLFGSLLFRYQGGLETSVKGSNFIFDCVHLLYYKCHKINVNCSGSNTNSPGWIKNKKAGTNPVNDDDKCFQYTATVVLNREVIEKAW